ncbi:MAG: hypothetical protein ACW968_15995 [Candidatus Thorarchaeota archaeon]
MNSICPVCGRLVENTEAIEVGKVFFVKTCPKHDSTKTLISSGAEYRV